MSDGTNAHAINLNIGSGSTTVSGELLESGGANLAISGLGSLTIGGDFTRSSGVFTAGSGMVTYNGSEAQRVAARLQSRRRRKESLNNPSETEDILRLVTSSPTRRSVSKG